MEEAREQLLGDGELAGPSVFVGGAPGVTRLTHGLGAVADHFEERRVGGEARDGFRGAGLLGAGVGGVWGKGGGVVLVVFVVHTITAWWVGVI